MSIKEIEDRLQIGCRLKKFQVKRYLNLLLPVEVKRITLQTHNLPEIDLRRIIERRIGPGKGIESSGQRRR